MIAGLQQKLWTCDFCFHQEPSAFSNGSFQVFILWEKPFYYELKLIGPLGRDRLADDRPDRTGTLSLIHILCTGKGIDSPLFLGNLDSGKQKLYIAANQREKGHLRKSEMPL